MGTPIHARSPPNASPRGQTKEKRNWKENSSAAGVSGRRAHRRCSAQHLPFECHGSHSTTPVLPRHYHSITALTALTADVPLSTCPLNGTVASCRSKADCRSVATSSTQSAELYLRNEPVAAPRFRLAPPYRIPIPHSPHRHGRCCTHTSRTLPSYLVPPGNAAAETAVSATTSPARCAPPIRPR